MKIFSFFCLMAFAFLILPIVVLADQPVKKSETQALLEDKVAIIEPGVLPNSFWYWADKFAEQIRFVFTVGKEGKADYLISMAEERLAEMRALSHEGITQYADKLLTENEELIKKAQELYKEIREEAIKKGKELQVDTEKKILVNEKKIKKELDSADQKYQTGSDSLAKRISAFLKQVISHLSWKKDKIQEQRNDLFDE